MKNKNILDRREYILRLIYVFAALVAITMICFTIFVSQKAEFKCDSGNIELDLLINETSFSHFQLKRIDGLTCEGKFPLGNLLG